MKRSKVIELVLIGSSFVYLSACNNKSPGSFANIKECEQNYGEGNCAPSEKVRHGRPRISFSPRPGVQLRNKGTSITRGGFGSRALNFFSGS